MVTKGKWERITTSDHPHHQIVVKTQENGRPYRYIADLVDYHNGEDLDNANLIAAAPELLVVCRAMQATADSAKETGHQPGEVVGANWDVLGVLVRQAITKAENN